jgi:hypothetical protein
MGHGWCRAPRANRAGLAYRYQSQQIRLQRRQLTDQRKATEGQLEATRLTAQAIADQDRLLERQQAEQIELSRRPAEAIHAEDEYKQVWMAVANNSSARPIRDVVCRVRPGPDSAGEDDGYQWEAEAVAQLVRTAMPPGADILYGPDATGLVRVIPTGRKYGF